MNKIKIISKILVSTLITLAFFTQAYAMEPIDATEGDIDIECVDIKNNLRLKSSDESVKGEVTKLQKFLYENKFLSITPTGFFGSKTKQAVSDYQKSVNLVGTGFVGKLTREEIRKETCDTEVSDNGPVPSVVNTNGDVYLKVERTNKNGKVGELSTINVITNFRGASPTFYYECNTDRGFGSSTDYGTIAGRTLIPKYDSIERIYSVSSSAPVKKEWTGESKCVWYLKNSKGNEVRQAKDYFNYKPSANEGFNTNTYWYESGAGGDGGNSGSGY